MKRTDFDRSKYTVWALPHPLILLWVVNPGLAFNELVLGQRIPKVILIDKQSDKPMLERSIVPCPQCGAMNDARLWGKGNAFGHWFGIICPACEGIIPCLWNLFSLLILLVTFPVWFIPVSILKPRWIEYEKQRLRRNLEQPLVEAKEINWFIRGAFFFGGLMWLVWILITFLSGNSDVKSVLIGVPICLFVGLVWGGIMHFWMNRQGKVEQNAAEDTD